MARDNSAGALAFFIGFVQLWLLTTASEHLASWLEPVFGVGGAAFIVLAIATYFKTTSSEQDGYIRSIDNSSYTSNITQKATGGVLGKLVFAIITFVIITSII